MSLGSLSSLYATPSAAKPTCPAVSSKSSGPPDPTHMNYAEMKTFADQLYKEGKVSGEEWSILTFPIRPWHGPSTILEHERDTPFNYIEMYRDDMSMAQRSQDYEFSKNLIDKLEKYTKASPVDVVV